MGARFVKMHGCGNDFVVFDERAGSLGLTPAHAAAIALLGNYIAASFVTAADGHGGTVISEAAQTANQQPLLTHPHAT